MFNNLPQPAWFTTEVYEHVRKLALIVNPRYNIFAPWATNDKYIRLMGGKHFEWSTGCDINIVMAQKIHGFGFEAIELIVNVPEL